jgi:hypothetical protein
MLTVEQYDAREKAAMTALPNRVVEMVNPVVFAAEGYPTRLRSDSELWKYLDVMHETRFERDFATLFGGGLTEAEFGWLQSVARLAHGFSQKCFGRSLTARGSLLRALNVYRHINNIFGGAPVRVFELGPGSGYLGCLFVLNNWSYAASDITQAFYLTQNRLWDYASEGRLRDLAVDPAWDGTLAPGQPVHVPWWEFFNLRERGVPSVDVVTCNHALAEMHPHSMAFALRIAHEMLRGDGMKIFIFEGWGFEKFVPRSMITERFYRFGYRLVHNDSQITVFAPNQAVGATPSALWLRLASAWKFRRQGNHTGTAPATSEWSPLGTLSDIKSTVGSLEFLSGMKRFYQSFWFWPSRVSSQRNPISAAILQGRKRRKGERRVGLDQVNQFYTELLKTSDLLTADERFLGFIDRAV